MLEPDQPREPANQEDMNRDAQDEDVEVMEEEEAAAADMGLREEEPQAPQEEPQAEQGQAGQEGDQPNPQENQVSGTSAW